MKQQDWWENFFDKDMFEILFGGTDEMMKRRREITLQQCNFICDLMELKKGSKILDLCCEVGRHSIELAKRGHIVIGLDYSKEFLKIAKENAKKAEVNVEFIQEDMREIPFVGEFDAAINIFTSFGYFEKERDHLKVLKEIKKCLKPKGKFIIDIINREYLVRHFEPKAWQRYKDFYLLQKLKLDLTNNKSEAKWIIIKDNGEKKEYFHSLRIFTLKELINLLKKAELKLISYYGRFNKEKWSFDTNRTIILGSKA